VDDLPIPVSTRRDTPSDLLQSFQVLQSFGRSRTPSATVVSGDTDFRLRHGWLHFW
jgi:hypothetical protein